MTFAHMPPYAIGGPVAPLSPPRPAPSTCAGCMNKAGQLAGKNEQINRLKGEIAEKNETITDLQAALNDRPPSDSEHAELRRRSHVLANQEQEQRRRADRLEGELARAERTIANLHRRLIQLGHTP